MKKIILLIALFIVTVSSITAQQSIARQWNEELLSAIRIDFARPTVHARNLFHTSTAMYDTWALFDPQAETVFLGKIYQGHHFTFNGIATPSNIDAARAEMMSYTMFRLLNHRFANAPNSATTLASISTFFNALGYDDTIISTDYSTNSYAALGNYFAQEIIAFGNQDSANELNSYANQNYTATNQPLVLQLYEDNTSINPNLWQPLAFDVYVDQSGNTYPIDTPEFLSPEWGEVSPFALKNIDLQIINNGFDCYVYNDPGPPDYIQNSNEDGIDDPYKWYFALVASWSSHLDPNDNTIIDISPASIGNVDIANYPQTFQEYQAFYNFTAGGDSGTGHALNPNTGLAYTPQLIKRSDYARVLAEFWADGPDSETPPGHWFTVLNYVSDHVDTVKQFNGQGLVLSDLEWDVKSYLTLGGAMHDSAVNIWGIKGYYDYIRPVSAIRYLAGKGQSTDASLPSYDPHGMPLITNLIELVTIGDPLAGPNDENIDKIKIKAWKGPDYIADPNTDAAGVDWILGEKWWPYQRPTFVTPPFAGYLSGHSTFSRAAAEVLTLITGDAFFPGGMGTFSVTQNDFLVFEEGPTESFTLQWATYRDASDQTSLSRIWGGIHPPIDDIRGRIIGDKIGKDAYALAVQYFDATLSTTENTLNNTVTIYPNPVLDQLHVKTNFLDHLVVEIYSLNGMLIQSKNMDNSESVNVSNLSSGIYIAKFIQQNSNETIIKKLIKK
ncbi:T9SS type A sorting domain-containing protein [Lacinutrix jangbogonensis]|uniref:T9SS type A sorting domain-containing protein n=1 Tax=Lacinutrix jangbogonensis TaxID=1469557 RepID=UPI00053F25AC|nr:T9SS type A sorting domain-containing protein [Lacinutrix jangbogonensis]